jgi:hypothetical protein
MSVAVQVLLDTEVSAPTANRRAVAELFAKHGRHVWHVLHHLGVRDRNTDDLIAGSYSVAPVNPQHTYIRYAWRLGIVELVQNDRW